MIRLPQTLPKLLRSALEEALSEQDLELALRQASSAISGLFSAPKAVCSLDYVGGSVSNKLSCTVGAEVHYTLEEQEKIAAAIRESGMHKLLLQELGQKLASVSYSAFSWPFPRVEMRSQEEQKSLMLPQEYSLFLPFSSRQVVSRDEEYLFEGYLGLLFEEFPKLDELEIQLIVTLPELLSSVVSTLLAEKRRVDENLLPLFAHDIKRDILINREFLRVAEESSGSKASKALAGMKRSLLRMLGDVNAVLLADKEKNGKLSVSTLLLDINELVSEVVEEVKPLFDHAKVKLRLELASAVTPLAIDPALFPAALFNLLDNALKYSDPGSEVVVCTKLSARDRCLLEVVDSGCPIAPEERERIFENRTRGSNSRGVTGSGHGLYIAKQIVEAHKAELRMEESVGATKRFVIEFSPERSSSSYRDESNHVRVE